jgi:hypothetical protein
LIAHRALFAIQLGTRVPRQVIAWLTLLAVLSVMPWRAMSAPAVMLTVTPTTGVSPLPVTLTWSATGFQSGATCAGAGFAGWDGIKALSGSQTVMFTDGQWFPAISCSDSTGTATIEWVNPTQNSDGSTIAATGIGSLAGTEVFAASGATMPVLVGTAGKGLTSLAVTGITPGPYTGYTKAFNTEGIRSAASGSATKSVLAAVATAQASVTVNVQPEADQSATVIVSTAYEINGRGKLRRVVGTIPVGSPCIAPVNGSFWSVDPTLVSPTVTLSGRTVVAQCAAA